MKRLDKNGCAFRSGSAVPSVSQRLDSLDVMRSLAIVAMLLCHFPEYLSSWDDPYRWFYFFTSHVLGDLAAPIFLFLVGASQAISARRRKLQGSTVIDKAFRRGLALIILGLVLELATNGLKGVFDSDILPLIGVSLIALALIQRWHSIWIVTLCAGLLVATPWLRSKVGYMQFWGGGYRPVAPISEIMPGLLVDIEEEFTCKKTTLNLLKSFSLTGYFPLLPWIAFPFAGLLAGRTISPGVPSLKSVFPPALCGIVFALTGVLGALKASSMPNLDPAGNYIAPLCMYPESLTMFSLQLGTSLILFSLLRLMLDGRQRTGAWLNYCRILSRFSLSIYVWHELLIFGSLILFSYIAGKKGMYFYQGALSSPVAVILAIVFLVAFVFGFRRLDTKASKFSLEYWLPS